jgi:hypothetical protein
MNPNDISERFQDLLIQGGVAYQIFTHDGWHFLAELDASKGIQVKLAFNFTYGYTQHTNGKWYSSSRLEYTQAKPISGLEDDATLQRIAQDLYDEAIQYGWQHTPPRPPDR